MGTHSTYRQRQNGMNIQYMLTNEMYLPAPSYTKLDTGQATIISLQMDITAIHPIRYSQNVFRKSRNLFAEHSVDRHQITIHSMSMRLKASACTFWIIMNCKTLPLKHGYSIITMEYKNFRKKRTQNNEPFLCLRFLLNLLLWINANVFTLYKIRFSFSHNFSHSQHSVRKNRLSQTYSCQIPDTF